MPSKLHLKIGSILRDPSLGFSGYKIYEEYPVNRINPTFSSGRHKFDWVILDLQVVLELHGESHYQAVDFGSEGNEKALDNYYAGKYRDKIKAQAAVDAGFTYVEIPYTDIKLIDKDYIWAKIKESFNYLKPKQIVTYKDKQKERYNKSQRDMYRRLKERKRDEVC